MPAIAAVDIGANGMRMIVGNIDKDNRLDAIEWFREPVRLGQDAFGAAGVLSEQVIDRGIETLGRFRDMMGKYGVVRSKIVATSALREAKNRDVFVARASKELGMDIIIIGAEEEARLIHLAVHDKLQAKKKMSLLVDIGGGSVEITLAADGQVLSTVSYAIGTVRLMCELGGKNHDEGDFNQLVHEYARSLRKQLKKEIGEKKIDLCVGTGGNIECMGDLRRELLSKDSNSVISVDELNAIVKKLRDSSYSERVGRMGLRPDRADVIVPAAIVLQRIVKQSGASEITVPHVGLKDGLLLDIRNGLYGDKNDSVHRGQVLAWAKQLGRKYAFDEQHAVTVSAFSVKLFEATKELHGLNGDALLLLETAALLHDIGQFIDVSKHHKHTYYLLSATSIIGLSRPQMAVVANIARYHRMAFPNVRHEGYAALPMKDRAVTSKLAAILRIADAMDMEHDSQVTHFNLELSKSRCAIRLKGKGDLKLEKWKLAKKAGLFEEVFNMKVAVE